MKFVVLFLWLLVHMTLGKEAENEGGFFGFAKGIMNAIQGVREKLRSPPAAHKYKGRFHHPRGGIHVVHEQHEHEKLRTDMPKKIHKKTHKHNAHATPHPIDHRQTTVPVPTDKDQKILKTLGQILPKYKEKNETTPAPTAPVVEVTVAKLPPDPAKLAAAKIADAAQERTVGAISRFFEVKDRSQYIGHPSVEKQIEKEENIEAKMEETRIQIEEARQQLIKERESLQQQGAHHPEQVVNYDRLQHFEGEHPTGPIPHHEADINHVKPELNVPHQETPEHLNQNLLEQTHPNPAQPEQMQNTELVHPDPTHPEPVYHEPGHPDPAHPEPVRHEPGHPDPTHPDPVHDEPVHPDPVHHEPIHTDPGHHEPVHPEPTHHEPEQIHHDGNALHADQVHHELIQTDHETDQPNQEHPTMITFHHEAAHPAAAEHHDQLHPDLRQEHPEEHYAVPKHYRDNGRDEYAALVDPELNVHHDAINDMIDHSDLDRGRFADYHRELPPEENEGIILWFNAAILQKCSGSKIIRTSAKSLAEKAGAAQYAVHIEEELSSDELNSKNLQKRLADNQFDDSDYEIYQGVVGRPGIDFPILAGIPQTTFNCRKFGNGYFADLETECQVFHICESGKKISFLCPNGTIFQQGELICDWWFRVNCAASPGHYAESSEILSRARHRYRLEKASKHLFEFKPKISPSPNDFDLSDEKISAGKSKFDHDDELVENFDFEDIIAPIEQSNRDTTKTQANPSRSPKDLSKVTASGESQEFAESSSFVKPSNNFNGYGYENVERTGERSTTKSVPFVTTTTERNVEAFTTERNSSGYYYKTPETRQPKTASIIESRDFVNLNAASRETQTSTITPTTSFRRGSVTYQSSKASSRQERKQNNQASVYTTPNSLAFSEEKTTATTVTPRKRPSTYTTARRIETSRTTPFYTPTVPSIIVRQTTSQTTRPPRPLLLKSTSESTFTSVDESVSDHAIEMIKTLQQLNFTSHSNQISNVKESLENTSRAGLAVPPSSGPDTLHSLALYFATAVDNMVGRPETTTDFEKSLNIESGNVTTLTKSLVSDSTVKRYEQLFGFEKSTAAAPSITTGEATIIDESPSNNTTEQNDLDTEYSNNPVLAAAGTPQIRELAQVFTHALSAYLHDPTTFRRVLSEIRPTEPTTSNEITHNRINHPEDFNLGTGPTYLPSVATTPATPSTSSDDLEVLDFSDVTLATAKKQNLLHSSAGTTTPSTTTETPEWLTTATISDSTPTSELLDQSLIQGDHVPASRFLTGNLEHLARTREPRPFETTTDINNPIAMEINGGLIVSTSFPYFQDDSLESSTKSSHNDYNYLPLNSGESVERNFSSQPYGHGVKPLDSKPINHFQPSISSNNLSWNYTVADDFPSSGTTTTEFPSELSIELLPPESQRKDFVLPTKEILPPSVDDNDLQRAQSQSIVTSENQITQSLKSRTVFTISTTGRPFDEVTTELPISTVSSSVRGHFITHPFEPSTDSPIFNHRTTLPDTGKFSPNPWSTLAYTVFLDPLTINDGLMGSHERKTTVTPSPNTYLPRSTQTPPYPTPTTTEDPFRITTRRGSTADTRRGKNLQTTNVPSEDEYMEIMQRKANSMFGKLNDTSAHHLLNVMKKANKNKMVRKLILLLIQTCDDDEEDTSTTIEESRTALLDALIGMDGKLDDESELQVIRQRNNRRGKSINQFLGNVINPSSTAEPTTEVPITTYRRPYIGDLVGKETFEADSQTTKNIESSTSRYDSDSFYSTIGSFSGEIGISTTTNLPEVTTVNDVVSAEAITTTIIPSTTTIDSTETRRQIRRESRRIAKDLDDLIGQHSHAYDGDKLHKHSDARALDLLRSLYSLAGKFGKR